MWHNKSTPAGKTDDMRAIWTGAIGFGLVNIPVKMYSATQASELDLDMLDSKDMSNIKYLTVNEKTGREVSRKSIVKGYKYHDDYVVLTAEDFATAAAEKNKTIEITEFVAEEEIDPVYYETPYYLEPDKSGARAYALLREALMETKKVGIALFVMRNKEILGTLRATEDIIILHRMRFYEEVRDYKDLSVPPHKALKGAELKMAVSLIEQLSGDFDAAKYKDTYTEELLKLIEAKAKGRTIKRPVLRVTHTKSDNLMEQLKASLGSTSKRKKIS